MKTPLDLNKKARLLGFYSYQDYLDNSPHWHVFKLARTQKRCWSCGEWKMYNLLLHHVSYERLGEELDDDVITLCRFCHQRCHALVWQKKAPLATAHELVKEELKHEAFQLGLPLEAA